MPRTLLDRYCPEKVRDHWVKAFEKTVELHRERGIPTYDEIAEAAGVSRSTFYRCYGRRGSKGTGDWTLEAFCRISDKMAFTDQEKLRLLTLRKVET